MFEITNPNGTIALSLDSFPLKLVKSYTVTLSRGLKNGTGGWQYFRSPPHRVLFNRPRNTSACALSSSFFDTEHVTISSVIRGTVVEVYEFDDEVLHNAGDFGIALYSDKGEVIFNTSAFQVALKAVIPANSSKNMGGGSPAFCVPSSYYPDQNDWPPYAPQPDLIGLVAGGKITGTTVKSIAISTSGSLYKPESYYELPMSGDWVNFKATTVFVIDSSVRPLPYG